MKRYHHGGETAGKIKYDFSVNLNPLGMPAEAIDALAGSRDCFERYPDTDSRKLKCAVADFLGMAAEETDKIVCGAGAADIIYRLPRALGIRKALLAVPSFTEYERALLQADVKIEYFETRPENSFSISGGLEKLPKGCDAFFISNPVNPSGKLIEPEDYAELLRWCSETDTMLVTDECFIDFADRKKRAALEEARFSVGGADVAAVRSFTKIFSMAGLRCGYAVFSDKNKAEAVEQAGPPWNVSGPAAEAASAALGNRAFVRKTAEIMSAERRRVISGLYKLGIETFESDVNFVLFRAPDDFGENMKKLGAAVRDCSDYRGLEPCRGMKYYRTALLGERADEFLLEAAAEVLGSYKSESERVNHPEKRERTPSIMIQGTMSNAGKSIIAAGLCRILKQDGFSPAPFKSQNMALNSFVTADGCEIGRAQAVQAEACGIPPESDMNPVLLKPSSDTGSQVIVNGKPRFNMNASDYFEYKKQLRDDVSSAYSRLAAAHDVIVIEGAGSPAEINLTRDGNDFVNMGLAEMTDSPVILVGDIDRGGIFAQLAGTMSLLSSPERRRIKGVIANKFRGDVSLFSEGRSMLAGVCGVPVLGVVPYGDFDIDDEDSLSDRLKTRENDQSRSILTEKQTEYEQETLRGQRDADKNDNLRSRGDCGPLICVIRLPKISNFSDFTALEADGARVVYIDEPDGLCGADAVIIPGTKSTISDMKWMNETGLADAVRRAADRGAVVAGICGGFQMLGVRITDPDAVESAVTETAGIGLLPVETEFKDEKVTRQTKAVTGRFSGRLAGLGGTHIEGYEIHMGRTRFTARGVSDNSAVNGSGDADYAVHFSKLEDGSADGCVSGNVFGTYIHGLFDSTDFRRALLSVLTDSNVTAEMRDYRAYREEQYDRLADLLRKNLDIDKIYDIVGLKKPACCVSSADRRSKTLNRDV